ncbi:XdhC family protein [Paraburkholderia sediminicola]|uniref:XdhC family protein n=1 Tax=Paraburkholderia sediminicola TaxID=458836 RepID=UPI0038B75ADA
MDSVDLEVLKACVHWLSNGRRALLVTIVKTWGSSPRPEGALLVVRDDGAVVGSVSGGCIEDDIVERVRQRGIEQKTPEVVTYGIAAEEAHRFGLPCGGTIQLVLEPLSEKSRITELCGAIEQGRLITRTVDMATGEAVLSLAQATDGISFDGNRLKAIYGPKYRMLVIGAGQLSRYFCQMAIGLDYHVTVCDPRVEYAEEWDVAGATIVRTMPDDTVLEMKLDERCAVIALTHDPKLDDLALMEALKTRAFYVGAIGSRRNNASRRERLKEFDLSDQQLSRLRGPAGVYIGSRTPPEIAVSILAEITAMKNGVVLPTDLQVEAAKTARDIESDTQTSCRL